MRFAHSQPPPPQLARLPPPCGLRKTLPTKGHKSRLNTLPFFRGKSTCLQAQSGGKPPYDPKLAHPNPPAKADYLGSELPPSVFPTLLQRLHHLGEESLMLCACHLTPLQDLEFQTLSGRNARACDDFRLPDASFWSISEQCSPGSLEKLAALGSCPAHPLALEQSADLTLPSRRAGCATLTGILPNRG